MHLVTALRLALTDRPLISIVGGGGKSATLFRLGEELASAGGNVVLTSTAILFRAQTAHAASLFQHSGHWESVDQAVKRHFQSRRTPLLLIGALNPRNDRVAGLPPAWVDRLWASPDIDAVVVEADRSHTRPLKAPAPQEPVIPTHTTHLVRVVGLAALGKPLTAEYVHRPELAARLSGQPVGSIISAETIRGVLNHPEGGRRFVTTAMHSPVLINQVDDVSQLSAARSVAESLLQDPSEEVVLLTHLQAGMEPVWEAISPAAAVVLAAGAGRRMGRLKQLLPWQGRSLLVHVLQQVLASDIQQVVLVLGAEAETVAAALPAEQRSAPRLQIVVNEHWREGQSSSVCAGLSALPPTVGSATFVLADQPGVTPELLNALLQRHRETLAPLVLPHWHGRRGNPVLFDRTLFPALRQIQGDQGGRAIFSRFLPAAAWLDWPGPSIWEDIDTLADYQRSRHGPAATTADENKR